jgi:hypothetical protein
MGTESTFGTETGSYDYTLETEVPSITFAQEIFERDAIKNNFHSLQPSLGSRAGAEITLKFPMHGLSATIPSGGSWPTSNADSVLMKSLLGGVQAGAHLTGADAEDTALTSTASVLYFGPGLSNVPCGSFVTCTGASAKVASWTSVTDGAVDNNATMLFPMEAAPVDGSDIWVAETCYMSTDQPSSFSLEFKPNDTNLGLKFLGAVPYKSTISLDPGGVAMMEVTFWCGDVEATSGAMETTQPSLPVLPAAVRNQGARATEDASGTEIDLASLSISIEGTVTPIVSHNAAEKVKSVLVTDRIVTMESTIVAETGFTLTVPTSGKIMAIRIGSTPGQMLGILMPAAHEYELTSPTDQDGLWAQTRTFRAGRFTGDSAASGGGGADTPFRIAFG